MSKITLKRILAYLYFALRIFNRTNMIVSCLGTGDDLVYCKSKSMQVWLFGYEITDTLIVFGRNKVFILTGKKKVEFLSPLQSNEDENLPQIELIVREKGDNKVHFDKIFETLEGGEKKTLGTFVKDTFESEFIKSWEKAVKATTFEKVDLSKETANLLAVKDEKGQEMLKKSSELTSVFFTKYIKDQLVFLIDKDKKIKHSKFSEQIEQASEDKKNLQGYDPSEVDSCFPPIIQSGGKFQLKFSAESDERNLAYNVITIQCGLRLLSYCSCLVRTFMVNPTKDQTEIYELCCEALDLIITSLVPGAKFSDVCTKAIDFVRGKKPELVQKLTKNFGFVTGIEFREGQLVLNTKSEAKVTKGMSFVVTVGFENLKNRDAKSSSDEVYAIFVGDTVVAADDKGATVLTTAKRKAKNVSIHLKDDDDDDDDDGQKVEEVLSTRRAKAAVLQQRTRQEENADEKRKQRQREISRQLNEQAKRRLLAQKADKKDEGSKRKVQSSYKNASNLPFGEPEVRTMKLHVDRKTESLILPIQGIATPFHISTIKNISSAVEGEYTYLRINFFHPSGFLANPTQGDLSSFFIKEINYRASNIKKAGESMAPSSNLNNAFRMIKDVQKRFKAREAEEKEKEGIVKQQDLVINPTKGNPKLKDLYCRPTLSSKKLQGSLESHTNGFRYTSMNGDKVDILFNNIKIALFQPCDKEMIIALHFHLKNALMIGKKKHLDLQFFTEVGEITTDLGKSFTRDRDDVYEEQQERVLRHKLKSAFKSFIDRVEQQTKNQVEFEVPFRELGFFGVPHRSTCFLQPTSSALANVVEWPTFVVVLEEVELVHFERVQFQLKHFDMVFIFKDYFKKPAMVSSIPMQSIDAVKDWLNSCDIKYTEGLQSLNWAKIMKTITDNPEAFFADGGWEFLEPQEEELDVDDDSEVEDETFKVRLAYNHIDLDELL